MNPALTLQNMALALTDNEIYKLVSDQMIGQADELGFNDVVGSIDEAGGSAAWCQRVTDFADSLELDACYVIAVDCMLPIHLVRKMHKAECKRIHIEAQTEAENDVSDRINAEYAARQREHDPMDALVAAETDRNEDDDYVSCDSYHLSESGIQP